MQLKTPLDLELNLFENSFVSKDLLSKHHEPAGELSKTPAVAVASGSTITSQNTSSSLQLTGSSVSASSGGLEMKASSEFSKSTIPEHTLDPTPSTDSSSHIALENASQISSNNKHNLRILNFSSLNNERLPGLTPPVFTPGGRRLPPIQLLPGAMGSPGTPGSNMWSSLLNVTNGNAPDQTPTQYTQPGFPNYPGAMRKLGLVPTESNLRSGLTPGILHQNGFNFSMSSMPDLLGNGQMTPGLLTLLGLTNTSMSGQTFPVPMAANPSINTVPPPSQPEQLIQGPEGEDLLKSQDISFSPTSKPTKRRAAKDEDLAIKSPRTKAAKTNGTKAKDESPVEETEAGTAGDEESRRKQLLERNRVAASKCRQRKKQLFTKMESELTYYSNGFRELSVQVTQLRDQLLLLRGVLMNHKDCPTLVQSAGGFQQLQNILGQSEYVAHLTTHAESNLSSMPSTIPTTLNPSQLQIKPGVDGPLPPNGMRMPMGNMNQMPNNVMRQNYGRPTGPGAQTEDIMRGQGDHLHYDASMARHPHNLPQNGADDPRITNKSNLRPVSSTSNLQSVKVENDLRPIASMADMAQHHQAQSGQGIMPKQFQL